MRRSKICARPASGQAGPKLPPTTRKTFMKRQIGMLAGIALLVTAGAANADTITGSWSGAGISAATSPNTLLLFDSALPATGTFSVSTTPIIGGTHNGDLPESQFITVSPGSCLGSGCNAATATVSVTFGQIKDGLTVLSSGFTITGAYSANFGAQTDDVVWNSVSGATLFGAGGVPGFSFIPEQDGSHPGGLEFAFADGSNTVDLFVLNGADWNVVTDISAGVHAAAVPAPIVGAGLPGLIAGCFALLGLRQRRQKRLLGIA